MKNLRGRSDFEFLPPSLAWIAVRLPLWVAEVFVLWWWFLPIRSDAPVHFTSPTGEKIVLEQYGITWSARMIARLTKRADTSAEGRKKFHLGTFLVCCHIWWMTLIALLLTGAKAYCLTGHTGVGLLGQTVIRWFKHRWCPKRHVHGMTGNGLTAAVGIAGARRAMTELGIVPQTATLAVIGAYGSIGKNICQGLGPDFQNVIVIGRPAPPVKTEEVTQTSKKKPFNPAARLAKQFKGKGREGTKNDLIHADVIVISVSDPNAVVTAEHIRTDKPVLIVDISVPHGVEAAIIGERPNAMITAGGAVKIPGKFYPGKFTSTGDWPACIAELITVAMTNGYEYATTTSTIDGDHARELYDRFCSLGYEAIIRYREEPPQRPKDWWVYLQDSVLDAREKLLRQFTPN